MSITLKSSSTDNRQPSTGWKLPDDTIFRSCRLQSRPILRYTPVNLLKLFDVFMWMWCHHWFVEKRLCISQRTSIHLWIDQKTRTNKHVRTETSYMKKGQKGNYMNLWPGCETRFIEHPYPFQFKTYDFPSTISVLISNPFQDKMTNISTIYSSSQNTSDFWPNSTKSITVFIPKRL